MQHDVGHDGHRRIEIRLQHIEADLRRLAPRAAGERGSEIAELVFDLNRGSRLGVRDRSSSSRDWPPLPCPPDRRVRPRAWPASTQPSEDRAARPRRSRGRFRASPSAPSGALNGRSGPVAGCFERSSAAASRLRRTMSPGWKRIDAAVCRVSSQRRRRPLTSPASSSRYRCDVPFELRGSPRYVLYWLSRSALPPKPPMRSRPEMKLYSCFVFARLELLLPSGRASPAARSRSPTIRSIVGERHARTRGGLHHEHAGRSRERAGRRATSVRKRLVVDERLVEPRRQTVGQDASPSMSSAASSGAKQRRARPGQ